MAGTGSESTTLIVLRGNSASGKSTVASAVRDSRGPGIAIVGQDNLRRTVLRERDVPGGAYIGLVDSVARYALDHGYHTIVEGILAADRCAGMLTALRADHRGGSHYYYFDVPLEETFRRHATKPQASDYGRAEMSRWYRDHDLLPGGIEQIIPVTSTLDATIGRILRDTGLPMLNPPVLKRQFPAPAVRRRAQRAPGRQPSITIHFTYRARRNFEDRGSLGTSWGVNRSTIKLEAGGLP